PGRPEPAALICVPLQPEGCCSLPVASSKWEEEYVLETERGLHSFNTLEDVEYALLERSWQEP
ncbi:MAG: hypothetical protein M3Y79_13340, partial [Pseudomonadota bacterium]|nr:hypothetical protein [Pseudomonadota bacterium]